MAKPEEVQAALDLAYDTHVTALDACGRHFAQHPPSKRDLYQMVLGLGLHRRQREPFRPEMIEMVENAILCLVAQLEAAQRELQKAQGHGET